MIFALVHDLGQETGVMDNQQAAGINARIKGSEDVV